MAVFAYRMFALAFGVVYANDPCNTPNVLNNLKQRVIGYNLTEEESPLCDYYMSEGWYSMGENVIASTDEKCGTAYNWYRQGDLPKNDSITEISACQTRKGSKVVCPKKIKVKRCADIKYVFNLEPTDGCPEAYCIEPLQPLNQSEKPPDISSISTVIDVEVVNASGYKALNWYCNFKPPRDTDYFYNVEYGVSSGVAWEETVKVFDPVRYVNTSSFKAKTALTERMLEDKGFHIGVRLVCSVSAQNSEISVSSPPRVSNSKFYGIEVLNKSIQIDGGEEMQIFLKLTAPIGCPGPDALCGLHVNIYIPESGCQVSDPAVRNQCGVIIYPKMVDGSLIPLNITSKQGQNRLNSKRTYDLILRTHMENQFHPFFSNYKLEPVKVEIWSNMTLIKNKLCYSHNDPHMQSFDGHPFENQNEGKFILYRNTKYQAQVQIQTRSCFGKGIYCNCGVAVSAGRDIIILNNCDNGDELRWWINFRKCPDRVLDKKFERISATEFNVHLPTGAKVVIKLYGALLNVDIYPGLMDYEHTEGLCGPFDGETENDRQKRIGSTATDPNLSWSVQPTEDLFNSSNDDRLVQWSEDHFLCGCSRDPGSGGLVPKVDCDPDTAKRCPLDNNTPWICILSRRKRNARGSYVERRADFHKTSETSFESKRKILQHVPVFTPKQLIRRKVYDYDTAKADCLEYFNNTIYQKCSSHSEISLGQFIEDCITDVLITNTMDWSLNHLEALKGKCVHEVSVNQPLPVEVLKDVKIMLNGTFVDFNSTNNETNIPEIPTFSTALKDELENASCPNECNGRGICKAGQCTCSTPFIGHDCSVDKTAPPVMQGIPDRGECDLQERDCAKTSVYVYNVAETNQLFCRFVPLKYGVNGEITQDDAFEVKGELLTFVEVSCPFENTRKKRTVKSSSDINYLATGYRVAITNDQQQYSEEDVIVIFDSECVTCSKNDTTVVCKKKLGYCVRYGQCFSDGDINECEQCVRGTDGVSDWEHTSDCTVSQALPQDKKLWIIAAVLGPVIFLVAVFGAYRIYKRTKMGSVNLRRKVRYSYD